MDVSVPLSVQARDSSREHFDCIQHAVDWRARALSERAAREQAETRATSIKEFYQAALARLTESVKHDRARADTYEHASEVLADYLAERDEARGAREQAERALAEERAHANRLAEGLERVRVGCNLGTAWPMVDELIAEHAARRGG